MCTRADLSLKVVGNVSERYMFDLVKVIHSSVLGPNRGLWYIGGSGCGLSISVDSGEKVSISIRS
jgi:hypothetical protein